MIEDFLASEEFLALLGAVVTALVGLATTALTRWTGIQIEAKHMVALHEALLTGAESAIRHGPSVALETLKAHAVAHARESVPDALKALAPGDGVLDRLAERFAKEAMSRLGNPNG